MTKRTTLCSVLLPVLLVSAALSLAGCEPRQRTRETTLDRIQRTGVLEVGYVLYPPTVVKDPNSGQLSGHFVDAVEFIGELMGVEVRYQESDFNTFAAGLQSGQYDLSIAATYRTIPRAMAVAFTEPIIYIGNGAIVRADDSRFNGLADINKDGVVVAVAQGEASHEYAAEHLKMATLHVLATSNLALPLAEVAAGRADVGLADAWSTAQFAAANPEVKDIFAGHPYDLTPVGWAVRHGDHEFLNFINVALDYCESTGRMEAWEKKYDAHWVRPRRDFVVE